MNLEHKILSCNWNLRENEKKKTNQPKFWGNSLLKKQLIGNLWSLPELPYISKWPKVLFSERVWTDTKEIRPEELGLKESLASGMCQNLDSIPCRAMEISVALAGTHEPPPYWSSPCSQAPNPPLRTTQVSCYPWLGEGTPLTGWRSMLKGSCMRLPR